ncbi:efflux RND transporter periplasmic adaptor subunit [Sphingomonas sp. BIUV-7]|uniref:Efflux RND transporter periplasmic adaptor subunit n=1 Tax=Sphingomonas natans TaxID=3063330 RepID=A0ABT8Y4K6_9SPHN|nr:efflux RND transporter periplasmic adaptor subunit [Sphingomonas sp. BIUV-7]MDO6413238.1 efflux RND transporter periplasmic adaptor subunit [Sphingomonas sp. BIUV-7]
MSENQELPPLPDDRQTRNLKRFGIGAAIVAVAVVGFGIVSRNRADHALAETASTASTLTVTVVHPTKPAEGGDLALPGTIQAFNSAAIYARTSGYMNRWLVDIGDRVTAGQALAILDAPDLDQQLAQARADYQTTLAQESLAKTTSVRWAGLRKQDAVSQQEADEKAGDYKAKIAVANASLANVKRLEAEKGFTILRAPFAGTVTSRSAQNGALVISGTAAAQPLFTVSDNRRMRIYVRVPQTYSGQVRQGMVVKMTLPEFPGRTFTGTLTRSAGAIDNASGAVLVQVEAPNASGELKPGAFVQVSFPLNAQSGALRIPASALIFGADGTTVATVDPSGHVAMKKIVIARDLGKQIEVAQGLKTSDQIVDTPPDAIQAGDQVKIAQGAKADDGRAS